MSDFPWQNNQANKTPNSPAPQTPPAQPSQPAQPDPQFKSENIGKWASRQENPFAAQNRKDAAKKREKAERRKKASPIIIISISVIAIIAAIAGLTTLVVNIVNRPTPVEPPKITGSSLQDISDYRDALQELFNQNSGTNEEKRQEISQAVEGTLNTNSGKEYTNSVILAQASFYLNNGMYDEAMRTVANINPDELPLEQQVVYYNVLYTGNDLLGNGELAERYSAILYDIVDQLGGIGG